MFLLPRQFGLLAMNSNIRTHHSTSSKFWLIYSITIAVLFAIFYPISVSQILPKSKKLAGIKGLIDIGYHSTVYAFSLFIYSRSIFQPTFLVNYYNSGIQLVKKCKRLNLVDINTKGLFTRFFIHVTYTFFGYTFLNLVTYLRHVHELGAVPLFYHILPFIPDFVIGSTMIRLHATVLYQTICVKRINLAFSNCIDNVNASIRQFPAQRCWTHMRENDRLDQIIAHFALVYKKSRIMEQMASSLIIFSILKASFLQVVMVNIGFRLIYFAFHAINLD